MNTLTFLNQPLLWGLGLASIPILIHLLFRRQYRRVDWAPMRYLKLSVQRNRRRVRLEQLLLLLLRTALVLLLFFLVARPVMHAEGLSRWLGTTSRTNRIVVVNDSLSMGLLHDGKTALSRAQEVVADLLPTFGPQDRLTLVLASAPRQPVLREVELDHVDDLVRGVRRGQTDRGLCRLAADSGRGGRAGRWRIVSAARGDARHRFAAPAGKSRWPSWAAAGPTSAVRLRVFDVGATEAANVALVGLEQIDRLALVGAPTRLEAEVRNDTGGELAGLEANLVVNGKPSLLRVPTMTPANRSSCRSWPCFKSRVRIASPSSCRPTRLSATTRRMSVVEAAQGVDMLLVDGEPSTEPLGGEVDFLALALSLAGDAGEAFHIEMATDSEWASAQPGQPDLLVLANVAHLTSEQVTTLERQVAAGMGLMIFVGDQLDPDNYNQLLFAGGKGLLPAAFEGISDAEFSGVVMEAGEGSPLEALSELTPAALQRIKVRKTYDVRLPGESEGVARVGAVEQPDRRPSGHRKSVRPRPSAVVDDRGRSQLERLADRFELRAGDSRSGACHRQNDRQLAPIHRRSDAARRSAALARHHAAHDRNARAKEPAPLVLSGAEGANADVALPTADQDKAKSDAARKDVAKSDKPKADSSAAARSIGYGDTRHAGFYKMAWNDSTAGAMSETFAVNPDRRESELERITAEEFKTLWGALEPEVITVGAAGDSSLAVHGQEIWRMLATGLFGLLVVEACFARWTGRQR